VYLTPDVNGLLKHPWVERVVKQALEEDLGPRDVTTEIVLNGSGRAEAEIVCCEEAVVCGLPVAGLVFRKVSGETEFKPLVPEGEWVRGGTVVAEVVGEAASILKAERVALNFLQHLSGVATLTRRLVEIASRYGVRIADTRKTLPGLRVLERYAVAVGGGVNHRFGLFDGVLIKDNHKRLCGGVGEAVRRANVTLLDLRVHTFNPHGVSGVAVIAESHISIHTWPEFGYAAVDIFTCGKDAHPEAALEVLREAFKPKRMEVIEIKRGIRCE